LASFKDGGYDLQQMLSRYVGDERFALRQEEAAP
jgi:hypothetical protein